jgi:hypothetical protein
MVHAPGAACGRARLMMRYRVATPPEYRYSGQVINGHTVAHLRPRHARASRCQFGCDDTAARRPHRGASRFLRQPRLVPPSSRSTISLSSSACVRSIVDSVPLLWSPPWEELRATVASTERRWVAGQDVLDRVETRHPRQTSPGLPVVACRAARFTKRSSTVASHLHRVRLRPGLQRCQHSIGRRVDTPPRFARTSPTWRSERFAPRPTRSLRQWLHRKRASGGVPKLVGADASHAWCSVYIPDGVGST